MRAQKGWGAVAVAVAAHDYGPDDNEMDEKAEQNLKKMDVMAKKMDEIQSK